MLNCRKATHLMSEARDRNLSFGEWVQLRIHLGACTGCRNFSEQLKQISGMASRYHPIMETRDDDKKD